MKYTNGMRREDWVTIHEYGHVSLENILTYNLYLAATNNPHGCLLLCTSHFYHVIHVKTSDSIMRSQLLLKLN